jgi:hypothetical protein
MPRTPWSDFSQAHPRAHLVVASIPSAVAVGAPDFRKARDALVRMISTLRPVGDYAAAIVRESGAAEIQLAFENETDARKLADAVGATPVGGRPGWASQRAFSLDAAGVAAIRAVLPRRR